MRWMLLNESEACRVSSVELMGGVNEPGFAEGDRSLDFIPQDWTPGEGPYHSFHEMSESTGMERDVSAGTTENDSGGGSDEKIGWGSK
jgi:hypothetical protein